MIRARVLGMLCAGILVGSVGSVGCSKGGEEAPGTSAQAISAAIVSLTLHDANGTRVGEGSGILIAPRLVLTSAHLVAGKSRWTVKTADSTTANGIRGLTYDWMQYDSNKSHPRKHDVAVIYLDQPITLAVYPELANGKLASGSKATRVRGSSGSFDQVATTLDSVRTFPHAYVTELPKTEAVDTGGAVLNEKNEIVGLVTGRGLTTGKLYVARTDALVSWLAPKRACGGAATSVRTYGLPGDGGSSGSSGSSGTSGTSGSSGSYGIPGSSGDGSGTGTCDDGGGHCSGDCASADSNGTQPGSSGSSGSSGTSGTSGSSGTSGVVGSSGTSGTSGTSGSSGSSGSDGSSGSNPTVGSSGAGGSAGDAEVCSGPSDNPDLCPPEPDGCSGAACGGGTPDDAIDYGGCACTGGSSGSVGVK